MIQKLKTWVKKQKINSIEAFKYFDQDFDGIVSRTDLRKSIAEFLEYSSEEINDLRLDRLLKLLSFYKLDYVQ